MSTGSTPARGLPQIRIVDAIAFSNGGGMDVADGRLVEFTVTELARLVQVLGAEGLEAFCAYLQVMRKELAPDGRPVLVIDEFNGAWLTQNTTLGRNAAYRAQKRLEDSGLMFRVVSRPGEGSRGKQRACLNPELVLIPGGADGDMSTRRTRKPGRSSRIPTSRETGNPSGYLPDSRQLGNRESEVTSPIPTLRETGNGIAPAEHVHTRFEGSSTPGTSSESVGVVEELLSSDSRPGLISALADAASADRERTIARLYPLFNDADVATRSDPLVTPLRLEPAVTSRPRELAPLVADLAAGRRDALTCLGALNVTGRHELAGADLAERVIVGVLIGLDMRSLKSWGAWLHKVTRRDWRPKPNQTLERFAGVLRQMAAGTGLDNASPTPPTAPSLVSSTDRDRDTGRDGECDHAGVSLAEGRAGTGSELQRAGGRAAAVAPQAPVAESGRESEEAVLDDAAIEQHWAEARAMFPMLVPEGSRRAQDQLWRSRVVRMYLTACQMDLNELDEGRAAG